jgi:hypothetical protein
MTEEQGDNEIILDPDERPVGCKEYWTYGERWQQLFQWPEGRRRIMPALGIALYLALGIGLILRGAYAIAGLVLTFIVLSTVWLFFFRVKNRND